MGTTFVKLSEDWNAEPNAPMPAVRLEGGDVILTVFANPWRYPGFEEDDRIELRFADASCYRLGATNDEGWHRGQCRFSGVAPAWGEFYELTGDLRLAQAPSDWHRIRTLADGDRHFMFYLRDETFECSARSWSMRKVPCERGVSGS